MEIIENELGQALQQIFQSIDENPIAFASLAQVHFAITKSNEEVAIKVQRKEAKIKF